MGLKSLTGSTSILFYVLMLSIAGCFPSSCRREEPRALFPSDSLSRQIAEATPVDTLRLLWSTHGSEELPLMYPRTVQFGPNGEIIVSDVELNRILVFEQQGTLITTIRNDRFSFPYLVGQRGDTLLVHNPEQTRIDFVVGEAIVHSIDTPGGSDNHALQYATVSDNGFYLKTASEKGSYLLSLDTRGQVTRSDTLNGPHWRYAGLLKTWGDSLLSLSGYRPVVDVLTPGGQLDTMALVGFDSPMLARSRAFMLGEVDEPPLLSASAAAEGPFLFVLNLRPGWLRIDVYDQNGRLKRVLSEANPTPNRNFYPVDLDVFREPDDSYLFALVTVSPNPRLLLYRSPVLR